MRTDRRLFVMTAGGAAVVRGAPSDQHTVGIIGCGGRGQYLLRLFQRHANVRILGVCDVYEPRLEQALALAGKSAKAERDYHNLLGMQDIDIAVIATPEHWHHRMLLDALAAGKDVYVEKPLCRTPEEGVELLDVAQRSRSVVQVGLQRRSYDLFQRARKLYQEGGLGTVRMVRSWWLNNGLQPHNGKLQGQLDWEQWQGPAPHHPLDPARFFDWRSYSDYSGGVMADQGVHVFDGIHMILGARGPAAVNASAGRIHKPGVDTPESVVVMAEYPEDFVAAFAINYAAMRYRARYDQLNQFDGDRARLDIGRENFWVYKAGEDDHPALSEMSAGFDHATETHVANFLECARTRSTPNATVEHGFAAALVTQMANLSLKDQRRVRWNRQKRKVE